MARRGGNINRVGAFQPGDVTCRQRAGTLALGVDPRMSKEGHPQAKVVDLRRWREERERRQRAAPPEPLRQPEPPRFSGLLRALVFMAGSAVLILCAYLGSIVWATEEGRGCALFLLLPIGGAALFALHLVLWGVLGRPWARTFWTRCGSWIGQRVRPLPGFLAVSVLLVALGFWRRDADPFSWEPALYWAVALLHIVFHEAGHLLAVYRVGYSPRVLRAGPLLVEWKGRRPSVRANRDWRFVLGGHVWFTPVRPSRGRDLAVLLAGPLANVLVLGAVLAVSRWLAATHLFAQYVRANVACAILVLLVNLLPLPRTRGYATDGRQILDILRGRRIA